MDAAKSASRDEKFQTAIFVSCSDHALPKLGPLNLRFGRATTLQNSKHSQKIAMGHPITANGSSQEPLASGAVMKGHT